VSAAVLAAESTWLEEDSELLLQAAMAPAITRTANTFFIRFFFNILLGAKVAGFSCRANLSG
jgi:hypothetical protein